MSRNKEKQYGALNRLYLAKEKAEYEKANARRPRLDTLNTPDEIKKWIPSIKNDIDFYLKKSQVTCYSDAQIEDCQEKVVKLEKEFKAFVRKMKQLSPLPLDVIPWTKRPYKRKNSYDSEDCSSKEFKRISIPILDNQKDSGNRTQFLGVNCSAMDQPLSFSSISTCEEEAREKEMHLDSNPPEFCTKNNNMENCEQHSLLKTKEIHKESELYYEDTYHKEKNNQLKHSIVNYDSSDCESS